VDHVHLGQELMHMLSIQVQELMHALSVCIKFEKVPSKHADHTLQELCTEHTRQELMCMLSICIRN
jgi:hypothetical protein